MSKTTNKSGDTALLDHMNRLSLSTAVATPLPPSSPVAPPVKGLNGHQNSTPLAMNTQNTKTTLRKAPSSSSVGSSERSSTPSLHKRASLGSLKDTVGMNPPRSPAVRRTPSYAASSPKVSVRSSLPPPPEEPPQPPATAASVAHDFFQRELEAHRGSQGVAEGPRTVVILQDDCYGHRYSRPRTSRANLGTVVERPERIHASILGIATAFVRLGERHAEGVAPPHPKRQPPSLSLAPFRIHKTKRRLSLRSPAAIAIHGAQWMSELSNMCDAAESKLALSGKELTRPSPADSSNSNAHLQKPTLHEGDLYLCSESLDALEGALGGVCEGIDTVFQDHGPRRAFVCIRPPGHHCSADMPSGFCWLNNVHVGIGHAALSHGLTHAAIIDFDLHHGDGSQSITWAHNSRVSSMPKNVPISKKTAIGYFSIHDINSYPCEMGDDDKVRNASLCIENAHGQNIWNVHLQSWKTDAEFWQLYEDKYSVILTKARSFLHLHSEKLRQSPTHPKPKAAIFLSAGFDASEWESPGMQRHQVNVPTSFYARLTRDVVAMAEEEGLGVDGRVISVLEGGYSDRALMSGVLSHISGLTAPISSLQPNPSTGLGQEMSQRIGKFGVHNDSAQALVNGTKLDSGAVDVDWWSLPRLEEVETLVHPLCPTAPKAKKSEVRPTYSSATQSYSAKIVSPRRSLSGTGANVPQSSVVRPPTPPPPAVDWATAAYELSKLLVPSDRETRSCRPEDLNAEASRVRRDRYSTVELPASTNGPAPVIDATRMQLRGRRGKTPQYVSEDQGERPVSRTDRRKTIADVSLLNEGADPASLLPISLGTDVPARHTRRRSSIASNASSMTLEKGPDLSLSSTIDGQPNSELLTVKKPRASTNPRAETTKPKPTKKQPPVPRFPSTSSTATIPEERQSIGGPETVKLPLAVNEDLKNQDVDQLASGMRKMRIKLNVPPKEEYEAKRTKSKPAPRGRPLKSAASNVASPAKTKGKVFHQDTPLKSLAIGASAVQQPQPPAEASDPARELAVAPPSVSQLPLHPAPPPIPTSVPAPTPPPAEMTVPLRGNTVETPIAVPTNLHSPGEVRVETPKSAPQYSVTPQQAEVTSPATPITAKRTKQELLIFTSTSPIMCGKSNTINSTIDQIVSQEDHTTFPLSEHSPPSSNNQPPLPMSKPVSENNVEDNDTDIAVDATPQPSASIWDVPDTPQSQKL